MIETGWNSYRLSDIIILIGGGTPRTTNPDYWNGQIPWLSVADFNHGYRYVHFSEKTITPKAIEESSTTLLKKGQLIISARGTVGVIAQLGRDMAFNQSCYGITAKDDLTTNDFLYYLLNHEVRRLKQMTHGAVFDTITRDTFDQISVDLPPLPAQQFIARILGSLDDKIELNRKMNETLEAMARAIFQSWFVNFDPVRAKAEGSDTKLPAEIAALFPNGFEEIDGRKVPRGWGVVPLSDSFDVRMGQSPPGTTYNENGEGIPFFQGRTDFGFRYPSVRVYCTAPTRFAEAGDTLVSVRAPVGDINLTIEKCCIGRGVAAVRHKTGSRSFTYYQMLSFKDIFAVFESEGTVFGSIAKTDFNSIECITPPDEIVKKFEEIAFPIDQKIENNEQQSRTLAQIRDALLPKLMSGELRVDKITA